MANTPFLALYFANSEIREPFILGFVQLRSIRRFYRSDGDDKFIIRVKIFQLLFPQLFSRHAIQKRCRCEHVAISRYLDVVLWENLLEQSSCRLSRKRPELPPPLHIVAANGTDSWDRRQRDAAGLQNSFDSAKGCSHVIDELECLRQDHTVKAVGWNII